MTSIQAARKLSEDHGQVLSEGRGTGEEHISYLMAHVGSTLLHSVRARGRPLLGREDTGQYSGITADNRENGMGKEQSEILQIQISAVSEADSLK